MVHRRPYLTSSSSGFALNAISRAMKKQLKVNFFTFSFRFTSLKKFNSLVVKLKIFVCFNRLRLSRKQGKSEPISLCHLKLPKSFQARIKYPVLMSSSSNVISSPCKNGVGKLWVQGQLGLCIITNKRITYCQGWGRIAAITWQTLQILMR